MPSHATRPDETGPEDIAVPAGGRRSLTAIAARLAWAHRRRHLLTLTAAAIGIAFVAGSLMYTDGVREAIDDRSRALYESTAAAVRGAESATAVDAAVLERVADTPGVEAASGRIELGGELSGPTGGVLPGIVVASADQPALRSLPLAEGRYPERADEALLDPGTAEDLGLAIGDRLTVETPDGTPTSFTLTGLVDAGATPYAANRLAAVLPEAALALSGTDGYGEIVAAAESGTTPEELAAALRAALGDQYDVLTQEQLIAQERESAFRNADLILDVLVGFVLIAIVTAVFVIANGFTITLAQRTRQLATLRLLGLTRAQLARVVLTEAALMGLAASLVGIAAGAGIAAALAAVLAATGTPAASLGAIEPGTVAATVAAGVAVTVASAALPAFKAARTAAIAALRDTAVTASRGVGRLRFGAGLALCAAGAAAWAASFDGGLLLLVAGGVLGFFGVVLVLPALIPLFAWAVERLPLGRSPVRLAVRHVARNRRRAASATAAIVLCTALVSAVLVGAHSARTSVEARAAAEYPADYSIAGADLPDELVSRLRDVDSLTVVHPRRIGTADGLAVSSTDPTIAARAGIDLTFGEGATVALAEPIAAREGLREGDTLTLNGVDTTVSDIFPVGDDPAPLAAFDVLTDADSAARILSDHPVTSLEVLESAPSASRVAEIAAEYPGTTVNDLVSYRESRTAGIDLVLRSMLALLFLSAVIAVVGLSNMLSLSMYERVKEHGTLRALGTTRGGLRAMVAAESVLVTFLGAAVGIGLGLAGAYGAIRIVAADQPVSMVVPLPYMALLVGVTLTAALAAALVPASMAARAPIAAAMRAE